MLKPTKILVPTDFSEYSDKALSQGLDIAKHYGSKVYLLHVVELVVQQCVIDYCLSQEMVDQLKKQASDAAGESLQKQIAKFPLSKEVAVEADVKHGVAHEMILDEAREKGIDLIVIASLGKTAMAKYLIGSVARNVLRGSKCPVLLTK